MSDRRIALLIFISLLLAYGYVFPRWLDWNANARFDLSAAIVERGTLSIDAYAQNTGDYALFAGKRYSDKAPGLSFLGVPVYFIVARLTQPQAVQDVIIALGRSPAAALTLNRPVAQVSDQELIFAARLAMTTWLIVGAASAWLGVMLFKFLGRLGYSTRWRAAAVLIYGLATPALTYSTAFYGHQMAAVLLMSAFVWLHALRARPARAVEWLLIGGLLGFAVITEFPAVLIAGIIGVYAIWTTRRRRALVLIALGGSVPIGLLGWYNAAIFGSPFHLGYQYTASPFWSAILSTGFLSASLPTGEAMWGLTFSPFRGLFFMSPILLLALPGLWLLRQSVFRAEWITSLAVILSFFVLISASAQWWGGWSAGPRYLVPMLPFLVWPLTETLAREAAPQRPAAWRVGAQLITLGLVVISIGNTLALSLAGQYYLPDDVANPLIEYAWPKLAAGDVARNWGMIVGLRGGLSLLPLAILIAGAVSATWSACRFRPRWRRAYSRRQS